DPSPRARAASSARGSGGCHGAPVTPSHGTTRFRWPRRSSSLAATPLLLLDRSTGSIQHRLTPVYACVKGRISLECTCQERKSWPRRCRQGTLGLKGTSGPGSERAHEL